MTAKEVRSSLIDSLKKELMGPETVEELIDQLPTERYITGAIYPTIVDDDDSSEIDEGSEVSDAEEEPHSNLQQPRSMGLSCVVTSDINPANISIKVSGAIYEESNKIWTRIPISSDPPFIVVNGADMGVCFEKTKSVGGKNLADLPDSNLDAKRQISLRWETTPLSASSHHISIFLVNGATSQKKKKASRTLYQCYILMSTGEDHHILSRPRRQSGHDDDIRSLELLYSNHSEFAVGHSTSTNWDPVNPSDTSIIEDSKTSNLGDNLHPTDSSRCRAVETTFFPQYNSKSLELNFDGDDIPDLNMFRLSDTGYLKGDEGDRPANIAEMHKLADGYEEWIGSTFAIENPTHSDTIDRHKGLATESLMRIREGIALLENDDLAYQSFCLMNRAIWLQFINKKQANENKDRDNYFFSPEPKWETEASWYPFQLGFILQNIPSVFDSNHEDRNMVDLLWVRTGGGKTEAYLGLVAFVMFSNRLRRCNTSSRRDERVVMTDLGCEVMMRYTLRLLTLQQFQRATRLIMACEYMRIVERFTVLEDCKPFSIGLYIGGASTPNKVKSSSQNKNDYEEYKSNPRDKNLQRTAEYALTRWEKEKEMPESSNPVQILECPWCGHRLGWNDHVVDGQRDNFKMVVKCGNTNCDFHRNPMPYQTVDETLYKEPPSLLIGTVDKFAQLAFNTNVGSLFGWRKGRRCLDPPNLIIQDELHLINGPLGSLTGLYEASIDYLCSGNVEVNLGSVQSLHELMPSDFTVNITQRPKIVASTATIRNADRQCKALYDRSTFRFPPSGVSIDDSYFVMTRGDYLKDKIYLGVLCSGVASKTTIKKVATKILSEVAGYRDQNAPLEDYDPFWTIISYYNSMRELGGSITLMRDDIRTNVQDQRPSMRDEDSIGELHGGLNSRDLPEVLERLQQSADDERPYDILTCTNMFSVGVDVDRLGLMMMNSQPKATTEYLQATGRVGRGMDGLVLVLFNQARPRDQSHFEYFYDYHSRIQLHVESMTLTPYSEGTVDRALHAQYVIFLRQAFHDSDFGIREEHECINFDEAVQGHSRVLGFCAYLMDRSERATGRESTYEFLKDIFLRFQEKWIRRAKYAQDHPVVPLPNSQSVASRFRYKGWSFYPGPVTPRLLEQDPASDWLDREKVRNMDPRFEYPAILTPSSLRNVEAEVELLRHRRKRNV